MGASTAAAPAQSQLLVKTLDLDQSPTREAPSPWNSPLKWSAS